MSSAPLFYLKGLGRFFIFISTSLPCGAQKKIKHFSLLLGATSFQMLMSDVALLSS